MEIEIRGPVLRGAAVFHRIRVAVFPYRDAHDSGPWPRKAVASLLIGASRRLLRSVVRVRQHADVAERPAAMLRDGARDGVWRDCCGLRRRRTRTAATSRRQTQPDD